MPFPPIPDGMYEDFQQEQAAQGPDPWTLQPIPNATPGEGQRVPIPNAQPRAEGQLVPSQFGDPQLSPAEAYAACGPAAAVAFARSVGRNPTLREAVDLAKQVGWTPDQGMAGPGSQQQLLANMGVPARMEQGVDWGKVAADVQGGNPVIIDTPLHYFVATGYDPTSGRFNFEASGTALKAGQQWMTPAEVARLSPPRSALYLDNPQTPAPSVASSPEPINRSSPGAFLQSAAPYAQQVQAETGIPANIMLGIAANETGYGKSAPGNNFFGIKGANPQTGASFSSPTWEVVNGQRVNITDTFRSYPNPADSFRDFAAFLRDNPRYAQAMQQTNDPEAFIRAVHAAGYATDPAWSDKVLSIARNAPTGGPSAPGGFPSSGGGAPSVPPAVPYVPPDLQPYAASPQQQALMAQAAPLRDQLAQWSGREGGYPQTQPLPMPSYAPISAPPPVDPWTLPAPTFAPLQQPPEPAPPEPAPLQNPPDLTVQAAQAPMPREGKGQVGTTYPEPAPAADPWTLPAGATSQRNLDGGVVETTYPAMITARPGSSAPPSAPPAAPPDYGFSSRLSELNQEPLPPVQGPPAPDPWTLSSHPMTFPPSAPPSTSDVIQRATGDADQGIGITPNDPYQFRQPELGFGGADTINAVVTGAIQQGREALGQQVPQLEQFNEATRGNPYLPYIGPAMQALNVGMVDVGEQLANPLNFIGGGEARAAGPLDRAGARVADEAAAQAAARQAAQQAYEASVRQFDQLPGDVAGSQRSLSAPYSPAQLPAPRSAPLDQPILQGAAPSIRTPDVIEQGGRPSYPQLTAPSAPAVPARAPWEMTREELAATRDQTASTPLQTDYLYTTQHGYQGGDLPPTSRPDTQAGGPPQTWLTAGGPLGDRSGSTALAIDKSQLDPALLAQAPNGYPVYRGTIPASAITDLGTVSGTQVPLHQRFVEAAVREGKPVPPAVLADYPDLARNAPTSPLSGQRLYHGTTANVTNPRELVPQRAEQWGRAVYFATNPDLPTNEFGHQGHVIEAYGDFQKPLTVGTDEFNRLATSVNQEIEANWGRIQDLELNGDLRAADALRAKTPPLDSQEPAWGAYFADRARAQGYDAIIDPASKEYGHEVAVLNPQRLLTPEEARTRNAAPAVPRAPETGVGAAPDPMAEIERLRAENAQLRGEPVASAPTTPRARGAPGASAPPVTPTTPEQYAAQAGVERIRRSAPTPPVEAPAASTGTVQEAEARLAAAQERYRALQADLPRTGGTVSGRQWNDVVAEGNVAAKEVAAAEQNLSEALVTQAATPVGADTVLTTAWARMANAKAAAQAVPRGGGPNFGRQPAQEAYQRAISDYTSTLEQAAKNVSTANRLQAAQSDIQRMYSYTGHLGPPSGLSRDTKTLADEIAYLEKLQAIPDLKAASAAVPATKIPPPSVIAGPSVRVDPEGRWWTNGFFIAEGKPPGTITKLKSVEVKELSGTAGEQMMTKLPDQQRLDAIARLPSPSSPGQSIVVLRNPDGVISYVNGEYYSHLTKTFPKAELQSAGPHKPIQLIEGGKVRGAVMPMTMEGADKQNIPMGVKWNQMDTPGNPADVPMPPLSAFVRRVKELVAGEGAPAARNLPTPPVSNLASGFVGATAGGYQSPDDQEQRSPQEQAGRMALGFGAGLLGKKVFGRGGFTIKNPNTPGGQTLASMHAMWNKNPLEGLVKKARALPDQLEQKMLDDYARGNKVSPLSEVLLSYHRWRGGPEAARLEQYAKPVFDAVRDIPTQFNDYVKLQRDIETANLARFGGGRNAAAGIKTAQDAENAFHELEQSVGPQTWKRLQDADQLRQQGFFQLLDDKVAAGTLPREVADALKTEQPHYNPTRLQEAADLYSQMGKNFSTRNAGLRKLSETGHTADTVAPLTTFVQGLREGEGNIQKNIAVSGLIDEMLQHQPHAIQLDPGPHPPGDTAGTISRMVKGVREVYRVDPEIEKLVKNMGAEQVGAFGKLFSAINLPTRMGSTTLSAYFPIGNIIRDTAAAYIASGPGATVRGPAGFYHALRGDAVAKNLEHMGIGQATYTGKSSGQVADELLRGNGIYIRNLSDLKQFVPDLVAGTVGGAQAAATGDPNDPNYARDIALRAGGFAVGRRALERVNRASEMGTRIAMYQNELSKGKTPQMAGFAAGRGTLDFSRMGEWVRAANPAIMFLGAQVGGGMQPLRALNPLKPGPGRTTRDVRGAQARATSLVAAAVGAYLWNRQNPDAYAEISQQEKDNFFTMLLPGATKEKPLHIALNMSEFAPLIGPITAALAHYDQTDPRSFAQMAADFTRSYTPGVPRGEVAGGIPGMLPGVVKGPAENQTNMDFYTGRPIVSRRMEGLPPSEQIGPRTSALAQSGPARRLTELTGMSPLQLDHLVSATLGTAGQSVLDTSSLGTPQQQEGPPPPLKGMVARVLRDYPGEVEQRKWEAYDTLYKQLNGQAVDIVKANPQYQYATPDEQTSMMRSANLELQDALKQKVGIVAPTRDVGLPGRFRGIVAGSATEAAIAKAMSTPEAKRTPTQRRLASQYQGRENPAYAAETKRRATTGAQVKQQVGALAGQ